MPSKICLIAVSLSFVTVTFQPLLANDVRFDVQSYVECQDVTTDEFRTNHPNEKLIQVTLDVAADIVAGRRNEVTEFDLRVRWLNAQHPVVDFAPRNITDSSVDGLISIERTNEKTSSIGLEAAANSGPHVNAAGHASHGNKNLESVRFSKKPKQHLLISSGMVNRGSGVFIKIRRSDQQSLEGLHQLVITFRVPKNWRGDLLVAECRAMKTKSHLFEDDKLEIHDQIGFVVPVYLQGDEQARYLALSYRSAESNLWQVVENSLHNPRSKNLLKQLNEMASWNSREKQPIDQQWVNSVVKAATVPADSIEAVYGDRFDIPKSVSIALKDFLEEKKRFQRLTDELESFAENHDSKQVAIKGIVPLDWASSPNK